ncbi:hypothetical protein AYO40_00205 [Planctomycetaceae bacterium SCGC AG-212-D15]|nr:hypothetical protein AYO40_00205 [Planctomycetaceae bacterium SCGC AG-212-D15]
MILRARIAVAALVLLAAGCGGKRLVAVEGTVTLDGAPLARASITLFAAAEGRSAMAATDDAGWFSVHTLPDGPGAYPGEYRVTVIRNSDSEAIDPTNKETMLHGRARAAPKNTLPPIYAKPDTTPLRITVPVEGEVRLSLQSHPASK